MDSTVYVQFGISVGLGLLVGLQRQWGSPHVAGLRTFAMITVFGTICARLAAVYGGWLLAAGLLAVAMMVIVGSVVKVRAGQIEPGLTTEVAALVMYGVGAMVVHDSYAPALMVGGGVAVLLQFKDRMIGIIRGFGEADLKAIMQLVLIAMVILPILPDKAYGPYGVLNPFRIWLIVVLIVGVSIGAFFVFKFFGAKAGTLLGGILGGIISSTATTVGYARRSRGQSESSNLAAVVVMIAATIVFLRLGFEIFLVAPDALAALAAPLAAMTGWMALITAGMLLAGRGRHTEAPVEGRVAELKVAIVFGVLYAAILFAVAAAREHFGHSGMYAVAGISGLTDMDAITLSTAQLVQAGKIQADTGWRMILIAAMSNLFFKAGAVALLGSRAMLKRVATVFALSLAGGAGILLFWPAVN
jgi:uncharacterized membrane protein (DUF4010 family)